jgi:hypothetical protein
LIFLFTVVLGVSSANAVPLLLEADLFTEADDTCICSSVAAAAAAAAAAALAFAVLLDL